MMFFKMNTTFYNQFLVMYPNINVLVSTKFPSSSVGYGDIFLKCQISTSFRRACGQTSASFHPGSRWPKESKWPGQPGAKMESPS